MSCFDYHRPQSLQEAWRLRDQIPGSVFLAGGTDVMVRLKNHDLRPPALISLRGVGDLKGIQLEPVTRIGAMTTIADLLCHPGLRQRFPLLLEGARRLGSAQIRNVATVGGNLCNASPCADMAVVLLALGARLELSGASGNRVLPLVEFFQGPGQTSLGTGEILTAILLDTPPENLMGIFLKMGRVKMDLALVSVAAAVEMEGGRCRRARLAAGSVAPIPLRLHKVEELLQGVLPSPSLLAEAQELSMKCVSPIDDIRASAGYRRHLTGVYVRRALEQLLGGKPA